MVITLCFHLETIKGTRFSQLSFLFSFTRIFYSSSPSDCESGELARVTVTSVRMKSSPGQKYYKFHEPNSGKITENLHHFCVNEISSVLPNNHENIAQLGSLCVMKKFQ